ncbi:MAG: acetyl-CoA carboxylase biotin carboxylase subunit [Anaerolineae bacterium]|nr:acetyl-CoA carboxylase biotin carboxylase subunit [Anaerolineae bacterium]
MFRKVLIANRGEIAVRILRACRELGAQVVSVYSDVDRCALHVRQSDEVYYIGQAPARDSYLRIDRIVKAARRSGADAIHPGYGFLAENPALAQACIDAGITFIGPAPAAIATMGDKVAARRLMAQAGVPVIPGTATDLDDQTILRQAEKIGFPLFVKAAAGGGGKGMRRVYSPGELKRALEAARREAASAFGDDRIYLERAVQGARHIEVQVLADGQGNVIHLGERECSIQRRHQKLIEESPSPVVDDSLRRQMGQIAVQAAAAVSYVNAGTVEFLLDHKGRFYFLEMNTRLQVEHPITECVTGIDIVKEQLRIAFGKPLPTTQDKVRPKGWAIECRITAEDPANDFLPASGRIVRLCLPSGPGVRVDSGIYEGVEISPHYDPLLAKLITWGNTRQEALQRMERALKEFRIVGVPTNIPFHRQAMSAPPFVAGTYDTSFIRQHLSAATGGATAYSQVAAVAAVLHHQQKGARSPATAAHKDSRPFSAWRLVSRREATGQ